MARFATNSARRPRRLRAWTPERLEDRALLSFAAGDLNAFGADGPAARPVETSAVALDASGNRFVSGSFVGTLTIGGTSLTSAGGRDAFVAKFAPDGSLLFARGAGGAADDAAAGLAVDGSGNVYLTGEFRGTAGFGGTTLGNAGGVGAFVWSLTGDGNTRFAAGTTGGDAKGLAIAVRPDGSAVAIGGAFQGTVSFAGTTLANGNGTPAGFVAALDATGAFGWASAFAAQDAASGGRFDGLAIGPDGGIVAAGRFQGTVDFDPGPASNSRTSVNGSQDVAVVSLYAGGALRWVYQAGGAGADAATGVAIDGKGRVFATGFYQQSADFGAAGWRGAPGGKTAFFLTGLDAAGNSTFASDLGASHPDLAGDAIGKPSVAVNAVGNVVVGTTFRGEAATGRYRTDRGPGDHALIATFDAAGRVVRYQSLGGSGEQVLNGIAIDGAGRVALTGGYTGLLGLGNTSVLDRSRTGASAFVATLNPVAGAADDFFGLNQTQPALYNPSNSVWSVQGPFSPSVYGTFGLPGDIPVPGDYERTGTTQMAVFRPSTAEWIVMTTQGPKVIATFGAPNLADIPAPADYDGVGYTQPAVFRPATAEWFLLGPNGGRSLGVFGATNLTDLPVPADYDGDGRAEPAVYRPSTAQWFARTPAGGSLLATFGATGLADVPAPGDFNGDGRAEPAVYRRATGEWFALLPGGGKKVATFGTAGGAEIPANSPAHYLQAVEASRPKPAPAPAPTPVAPLTPVATQATTPIVTAPQVTRRPTVALRGRR